MARQYEALAKDRDPRQQFREPQNPGEQPNAGVVGPMGASSFSLPTVEKAMTQMEGEDITARLARMGGAANGPRRVRWTMITHTWAESSLTYDRDLGNARHCAQPRSPRSTAYPAEWCIGRPSKPVRQRQLHCRQPREQPGLTGGYLSNWGQEPA